MVCSLSTPSVNKEHENVETFNQQTGGSFIADLLLIRLATERGLQYLSGRQGNDQRQSTAGDRSSRKIHIILLNLTII